MYWIVTPHCVCFMQPLYFRHHRDSYMYSFLRRPYFIQLCVACATKIVQCILVVRVSDPSDMAYYTCCVNDHVLCQMAPLFLCFITLADYQPALALVSFTSNFSECLSTFSYSFQESCSLYPKVHPVRLSGAHSVPSVGSQQLLQWVQCGVHHPQPDEVCEVPVHCHCTPQQPEGNTRCCGKYSHAK